MKKNKNAFTLIELLAIIVILAIIAVITVPIILNIIENSRKGAAKDSAYGYKDAVNKYYISELQNHNKIKLDGTYTINNDGSLTAPGVTNPFNEENYASLDVQASGTIPSSGFLTYENNVLKSGCMTIGDYAVTFNNDGTASIEKGVCPSNPSVTQYGYKSAGDTEITISTSNPTGKSVYLKYALTNGQVADGTVPEACIYRATYGGELCLKNNEYEATQQKILDYFGYVASGENAWIQDTNISSRFYNDSNHTITCDSDSTITDCYDLSTEVYIDASGISTRDFSEGAIFCNIDPEDNAECF